LRQQVQKQMHPQITRINTMKAAPAMLNDIPDMLDVAPAKMDPKILELQTESSLVRYCRMARLG
jgi:hypothetical protein